MSAPRRPQLRVATTLLAFAFAAACADAVAPADSTVVDPPAGPDTTPPVVVVPPAAAVARVELDSAALLLDEGAAVPLVATPRDSAGNALAGRAVAWSTSDASVAVVSDDGVVIARER